MQLTDLVNAANCKLAMSFYHITYILTERCIVQKETYICVVWLKSGQKNKKKAFFALSLVRSLENFKQGG